MISPDSDFHHHQKAGLWKDNPVLVHLLGLSPVLAISDSLIKGLTMGLLTLAVLVASTISVSLLRKHINYTWRFFFYLILLASFTSIADILMQWFYFPLFRELGIYIPLICCNFAILIHLESEAYRNDWARSLPKAVMLGLGYLLALVLLSFVRQLLATKLSFASYQPAAFMLLGLLVAIWNLLVKNLTPDADPGESEVSLIQRQRITGKVGSKT